MAPKLAGSAATAPRSQAPECVWLSPPPCTTRSNVALASRRGRRPQRAAPGRPRHRPPQEPVSNMVRLGDMLARRSFRFARVAVTKSRARLPNPLHPTGMDLVNGENGSTSNRHPPARRFPRLRLTANASFPRLRQAIAKPPTTFIFDVYIFDKDDVAVEFCRPTQQRSCEKIESKIILDAWAASAPPFTPGNALARGFRGPGLHHLLTCPWRQVIDFAFRTSVA